MDKSTIVMLGHIPYARRLVTAVLPPLTDIDGPAFQQQLRRLVTVSAPWNEAEGWRRQTLPPAAVPHSSNSSGSLDSLALEATEPLEGEIATISEPAELILWLEPGLLEEGKIRDLVGMGLRGRWGLFGTEDGRQSWWAFKAKDCEYFSIRPPPSCTGVDDQMSCLPSGAASTNRRPLERDRATGQRTEAMLG